MSYRDVSRINTGASSPRARKQLLLQPHYARVIPRFMTNPFSLFVWFWRSWRGGSVTSASLFALALFGVSAVGTMRHVLHRLDAPWFLWLLLPVALITALARRESDWIPDPNRRRRYAWGIVLVAILIVAVVAKLRPDPPRAQTKISAPTHFKP